MVTQRFRVVIKASIGMVGAWLTGKREIISKQNVNNLMDRSVQIALLICLRNEQNKKVTLDRISQGTSTLNV